MPLIRTPDERFANLPGFPYSPHYVEIMGARVHYVDEGQGEVVLCLHGEPTWAYLYRKMIPLLSQNYRVIAPDFIGFGRSDKFTERSEYSFQMHRDTLVAFIETLDLQQITIVVQDWGGLIGLRVASELPHRFARLVIMNTALPTGDQPMNEAFMRWRAFAENSTDLPVSFVVATGMTRRDLLPPDILAAYDAPFPDVSYKAGAMAFPLLVPISPDDPASPSMRHAREVLSHWQKPVQVMFSDKDPIMSGGERAFLKLIPTAKDQPLITIHDAAHFLQEEKGEEIASHIVAFMQRTPLPS